MPAQDPRFRAARNCAGRFRGNAREQCALLGAVARAEAFSFRATAVKAKGALQGRLSLSAATGQQGDFKIAHGSDLTTMCGHQVGWDRHSCSHGG